MNKHLKKYPLRINEVLDMMVFYYERLLFLGFAGTYPYKSGLIESNRDRIKKNVKRAIKLSAEIALYNSKRDTLQKGIKDVFSYYSDVYSSMAMLLDIYEIFEEIEVDERGIGSGKTSQTSLSQTFVEEMGTIRADAMNAWEDYIAAFNNNKLMSKLIEKVWDTTKIDKIIELSSSEYNKDKKTVELYAMILQRIIDSPSDKNIVKQVLELVENIKRQVLTHGYVWNRKKKWSNYVQQSIQTGQLVPAGPSKPLNKVLEDIDASISISSGDILTGLKKASALLTNSKSFGFIVIQQAMPHGFEDNIWTLTDRGYLEKEQLYEPYQTGVSQTGLKRFETIKQLTRVATKLPNITTVGDSKDYYYILETLDGENYRLLTPWIVNPRNPIYSVPGKISFEPSHKVAAYNHHLETAIMPHLKAPYIKAEDFEEDYDWTVIRSRIKTRMILEISKILKAKVPNKEDADAPLKDSRVIRALISATSSVVEKHQTEIALSYLADLENMIRIYNKELDDHYKDNKVEIHSAYGMPAQAKIDTMLNIYEKIIDAALTTIISNRNNIMIGILSKSRMMEKFSN